MEYYLEILYAKCHLKKCVKKWSEIEQIVQNWLYGSSLRWHDNACRIIWFLKEETYGCFRNSFLTYIPNFNFLAKSESKNGLKHPRLLVRAPVIFVCC